jgi:lantibiotic modifying enzyme
MPSEFLDAAESIARGVVGDAIWHQERCNWVGVSMDPKEAWQPEYHALGPALYDGTAGIGLFLAQLAAVTGDAEARRTAVGAVRQSLARVGAYRSSGFHAGCLGVAWAAAQVAELLAVDELYEAARTVPPPLPDACPDLILGTAGTILAQLALGDHDAAITGGEHLLASAAITDHGWSWADPADPRRHHLCGVSHGTAGIAAALVELYAATGDDRCRAAAEGAFAYERSWLHEPSGTWPDLRIGGQRRGAAPRPSPPPTIASWCHGEAGIAITRLRAIDVLGPGPHEHVAETALETARRRLVATLPFEIDDLTLCHGAAGAAEALLCAGITDLPRDLGRAAIERFGATARWPCTPLGGTTPSLFRGLAGIGWFFLRLYDQDTPSPLAHPARLTAATAAA